MKKRIYSSIILFLSAICLLGEPRRDGGISLHQLPKQVAEISGKKWGFTVTYADYLKKEKEEPTIQSAESLLKYWKKQSEKVQENGIWIVTNGPELYSDQEKQILEEIISTCKKENIPLFICDSLHKRWKRFDK